MTSGQLSAKLSGLDHKDKVRLQWPGSNCVINLDLIDVRIEKGTVFLIGSTGDPRWDKGLAEGK